MTKCNAAILALLIGLLPSVANGHYLWVTLDPDKGDHGRANIYFEETPSVGDGHYLDPLVDAETARIRTVEKIRPRLLTTTEERADGNKRWIAASLPDSAPRSIECYWLFGVYQYGTTNVLLHYYARYLDVHTHDDLHELGRAEHMQLDIVPHDVEDGIELTILWNGSPAPNRMVYIRGPKGFRKNIKTSKRGAVRFDVETAGRYSFRTSVEEDKTGRHGEKDYAAIRHNATLLMHLPLAK